MIPSLIKGGNLSPGAFAFPCHIAPASTSNIPTTAPCSLASLGTAVSKIRIHQLSLTSTAEIQFDSCAHLLGCFFINSPSNTWMQNMPTSCWEQPTPETAPEQTHSHRGCDCPTSPLHSFTPCLRQPP